MSKLEKYLSKSDIRSLRILQKTIFENEIIVTCVGLVNHGKSTLLNVLIKDFEMNTFKTRDARETTVNKSVTYNNIKYVDTPGLNAKEQDDEQVMEAIQNSDITLFVHTITTGELNKKEVEFLEKIQEYWSNPQEFIDRTIFVLSRIDNIEDYEDYKDIEKTSNRIKEQIQDVFSCNCLIVPISAIDYKDGMVENEDELLKESNIEKLKNSIDFLTQQSRAAILKTRQKKFEDKLNELSNKLKEKIKNNNQKVTNLKKQQKKVDEDFKEDIAKIESTLKSMYQKLENISKMESTLKSMYQKLENISKMEARSRYLQLSNIISGCQLPSQIVRSFFCQRCGSLIIFKHNYCDDCKRKIERDKAEKEAKKKRYKNILLDITSYKKQAIISIEEKYNSIISFENSMLSFEDSTLEYKQGVFICYLKDTSAYKIKIVSKNNDIQNRLNFLEKENSKLEEALKKLEIIKNETLR